MYSIWGDKPGQEKAVPRTFGHVNFPDMFARIQQVLAVAQWQWDSSAETSDDILDSFAEWIKPRSGIRHRGAQEKQTKSKHPIAVPYFYFL